MKAIAHSYWRLIKQGKRTFESVHISVKDDVRNLAKADVESGTITTEDYFNYIGEDYTSE